jgi:hypothetical protein
VTSDVYQLASCDLRDLAALDKVLLDCGLDKGRPTLFLSECVLIYMTVEESSALILWASANFQQSYFVLYEQVEPYDSFGKAMCENLKARNCPLLSILAFPTLKDQEKRFQSHGWDHVEVWNMNSIYTDLVIKEVEEKKRVDSLEFMDELEEWTLFNKHYCIVLASHHDLVKSQLVDLMKDESCKTAWKLHFSDLVVPVGPQPLLRKPVAVPPWMRRDLA